MSISLITSSRRPGGSHWVEIASSPSPTLASQSLETVLNERLRNIDGSLPSRIDDWRFSASDAAYMLASGPDQEYLAFVETHLAELNDVWQMLEDDESRTELLNVLLYRILGPARFRFPLDSDEFWALRSEIYNGRKQDTDIGVTFGSMKLSWFELPAMVPEWAKAQGRPETIKVLCHAISVLAAFEQEQYALERPSCHVRALAGDVVIDAGGCWGDTALYFANLVGAKPGLRPAGQVHVFEFDDANLDVFEKNCEANPGLAEQITLVRGAVWNESGQEISYNSRGAGTSLMGGDGDATAPTIAIDDYVSEAGLPSVDFIKMDIEGAEMAALEGAVESIRRFEPVLALSIYHQKQDFYAIPQWINDLGLGYRFFVKHFTNHAEETVLFAVPPRRFHHPEIHP